MGELVRTSVLGERFSVYLDSLGGCSCLLLFLTLYEMIVT